MSTPFETFPLLYFPAPINSEVIFRSIVNSPFTGALALIGARYIANLIDRRGSSEKRSLITRYLTITLPDNAPLSVLFFLGRIQNYRTGMFQTLVAIGFLTLGTSLILELGRFSMARCIDKIPVHFARQVAILIGPRDLNAR